MPPRTDTAARLVLVEESLARIESALAQLVPPADVREHIDDSSVTAEQIDALTDAAPLQAQQLVGIVTTLGTRMTDTELRDALHDTLFHTQQMSSIMQGTRADIVQMRVTLLRQAALLEQVLRARVEDEEWEKSKGDRRQIEDRRGETRG